MEFGIKKLYHGNNEKRKKTTEGIELPDQVRIWTQGEKENYKYLRILEADTIKQAKMKERTKNSISDERENYLKPNYIAEISSKG